jgi:hypothetical protein
MLKRLVALAVWISLAVGVFAQTPALPKAAVPSPTPSPTTEQLINSLAPADIQAAIALFKSNFTNQNAITETEFNRASLQGLLVRYSRGLVLLPGSESAPPQTGAPFYSEIFEGHIGYLRLGGLNSANLKAMDKKLEEFGSKKIDALVVDLREENAGSDFAVAAEFAKRFCPKGKLLFTLRKPAARQDRAFNSDRDPALRALMTVLTDSDTSGAPEAVAATLRMYDKALIIGQPTAGRAVEYSDLPLPSGKVFRVATAEAVLPDGKLLFPDGLKPDLPVEMSRAEKRQLFQLSADKGMAPFVYETERPHLNEAALIAGTNPELDSTDGQRRNRAREKQPAHDPVLQRALDIVTSLEIYQKR